MNRPSSADFILFARSIHDAIRAVQWAKDEPPRTDWSVESILESILAKPPILTKPPAASPAQSEGLLGSWPPEPEHEPEHDSEPAPPFVPDTRALDNLVQSSPAGIWIASQAQVKDLHRQLRRQAKRRGKRFADPSAPFRLDASVAYSMSEYLWHSERGTKPKEPSAQDWRDAIAAIDALKSVQTRGVPLDTVFRAAGFPAYAFLSNGLDKVRDAIEKASSDARRPYKDRGSIVRAATRTFVHFMCSEFGDAPQSMVVKFAEMIGYRSETIAKRHLPEWVRQYRTDSPTETPDLFVGTDLPRQVNKSGL